jgi:hypothetical protein
MGSSEPKETESVEQEKEELRNYFKVLRLLSLLRYARDPTKRQ